MAEHDLSGRKVAILATNGFERSELEEPRKTLREMGAEVHVVSPQAGEITSWEVDRWGERFPVDRTLGEVTSFEEYDALVLPGGQINPDLLRVEERAVAFVRGMVGAGKTVAAICHGPWLLAEADVIRGRTVTSYPSIRTDLRNAGAAVVDREVVADAGIVTSRKPGDLPAFCKTIAEEIVAGPHARRAAA